MRNKLKKLESSGSRKELVALLKKFFAKKNEIFVSAKIIHFGYTNLSYLVSYSDGHKYQIRFPHCNDLVDRKNEYDVLSLVGEIKNFIYFDIKTGVAIKKWVDGKNPSKLYLHKLKKLNNLFYKIKKLHSTNIPTNYNIKKINFDKYNENLYHLNLSIQSRFLNITNMYKNDNLVLNHTDINRENIILNKNKNFYLIDYEWSCLSPDYWDYANFIRESMISYKHIKWDNFINDFDLIKLERYIFLSAVYAYLWTWAMPKTKKIIKYRKKTLKQIDYFFHKLEN